MFDRRFADIFIRLLAALFLAGTVRRQLHSTRRSAFGAFASALLLGLVIYSSLATTSAQDKPQESPAKPTASPTPSKPGTDLEGPVIVNTDLITLTVTVTDTYGRYVSGLNKKAFTILDEKQPQEITYFSDDDAPARGVLLMFRVR